MTLGPRADRPVRVLHVSAMLRSGGVERWLVDVVPAAQARGLHMDIAVVQDKRGIFYDVAQARGIRVFDCPTTGGPWRFVARLRRLLRARGPYDVVHAHLHAYSAFVVLAAWLEGVPARVVHPHNVLGNASGPFGRRLYQTATVPLIRRLATGGLAPSAEAMADLLGPTWAGDPRWRVMSCGVDLREFCRPVSVTRADFGIPDGAFVMGTAGRLTTEKGHDLLVEVLPEVLARRPDAYLLMIGEGPLREALERRAAEGGFGDRLILAGTRTDVPDILRAVPDVFVFPSPPPPRGNEASPIAVVEAQVAGLPTVISDGMPSAAVVVPPLTRRLAFADGPARWADAVLRHAAECPPDARATAFALARESDANIERNVDVLTATYGAGRVPRPT